MRAHVLRVLFFGLAEINEEAFCFTKAQSDLVWLRGWSGKNNKVGSFMNLASGAGDLEKV